MNCCTYSDSRTCTYMEPVGQYFLQCLFRTPDAPVPGGGLQMSKDSDDESSTASSFSDDDDDD